MNCHSKNTMTTKGFSLIETTAAVIILGLICSSVFIVINRCVASAADSALRMRAFETTREKMEKLLVSDEISENVEYGTSEQYPDIQWQTIIETFYEPITNRMWVQAICSSEYTDSKGELQKIELTHWLTSLTKKQLLQLVDLEQQKLENLEEQTLETVEEAADYAGVDEQTIQKWIDNDMPLTDEGYFTKDQLSLYKATNGKPTIEDRKNYEEAKKLFDDLDDGKELIPEEDIDFLDDGFPNSGFPSREELENMTMEDLINYIKNL